MKPVRVGSLDLARFEDVVGAERYAELQAAVERGREVFAGRRIWNVNSTARGGGVAEMLVSLLAYAHGAGVDARWSVIGGDDRFFAVTKRLHNHLHGSEGDGGPLDEDARAAYEHGAGTGGASAARGAGAGRSGDPARPADRRAHPGRARRGGAGGVALPYRRRRAQRRRSWRLALPRALRVRGRRRRVLARGVRVGGPRRRAAARHRAVDRRVRAQELRTCRRTPWPRSCVPRGCVEGDADGAEFRRLDGARGGSSGAPRCWRERPLSRRRPLPAAGLALGPPQGPDRRDRRLRRARRARPRARPPRLRRPGRRGRGRRSRGPRRAGGGARPARGAAPRTFARVSTSRRCRWTTSRRTPRSSTRSSAARRSWRRRAWPRDSG